MLVWATGLGGLWGYVGRPLRPSVYLGCGPGQKGGVGVEPEVEVEVARSPFELWAPA